MANMDDKPNENDDALDMKGAAAAIRACMKEAAISTTANVMTSSQAEIMERLANVFEGKTDSQAVMEDLVTVAMALLEYEFKSGMVVSVLDDGNLACASWGDPPGDVALSTALKITKDWVKGT